MGRKDQICKAGQKYSDAMDEFQRYHTYPREAFRDGASYAISSQIVSIHINMDLANFLSFNKRSQLRYISSRL